MSLNLFVCCCLQNRLFAFGLILHECDLKQSQLIMVFYNFTRILCLLMKFNIMLHRRSFHTTILECRKADERCAPFNTRICPTSAIQNVCGWTQVHCYFVSVLPPPLYIHANCWPMFSCEFVRFIVTVQYIYFLNSLKDDIF